MISIALLVVMLAAAGASLPIAIAGVAYWCAVLLLWSRLAKRNRLQSLLLLIVGVIALVWSWQRGAQIDAWELLAGNSGLISMLVAVSFLALISRPEEEAREKLPTGHRAVRSTLLAVHLFGAVINLSSIFILGDRISRQLRLQKSQILVLVRGFSAAAFWSPFFAAMAVAMSYAPDASLSRLWLAGMPLAALALLLTYWQVNRDALNPVSEFTGYPMHFGGLWLPLLLAAGIFTVRAVQPSMSILDLITLLAPLLAASVLLLRREPMVRMLVDHASKRLPQMGNELTLFMAASVLGYGLERLASTLVDLFPLQQFGALEASCSYGVIIALAIVGVHPIISIALIGSLLTPLQPDHTLLALVFLSSWALGSAVGPLSGMNLAMQGRYGVDSFQIMRWNLGYIAAMSIFVVLGIWAIAPVPG